jgi:hypothetical protein
LAVDDLRKGASTPAQVALDRLQAAFDDLTDNVRGHEVYAAGPLRQCLSDSLQTRAELRRQPHYELPILGSPDDRPGH